MGYETISFLSDFGHADESVGIIKSVLRMSAPNAAVIDISHEIPPYDTRAASLTLLRCAPHLAPGIVIAAVGATDKVIAIEVGDKESVLIGSNNGVLAPTVALVGGPTRAISIESTPTSTCRNVMAPLAAALCNGTDLETLGEVVDPDDLVPSLLPFAERTGNQVHTAVLHIDRFGNMLLNMTAEHLDGIGTRLVLRNQTSTHSIEVVDSPRQLTKGSLGLLIDSDGLANLFIEGSSAQAVLNLQVDDQVDLVASLG